MPSRQLLACYSIFIVSFIGIILSLTVPVDVSHTKPDTFENTYGIVIDAGSTGSRIHIFNWKTRTSQDPPDVNFGDPLKGNSFKVTPGISSFVGDSVGLRASLKSLINYALANNRIPSEQLSSTPLFLRATAGMRLLSQNDQNQILDVIRDYFHSTPFQFTDDQASVIPGTYEGAYGWITVNHLLGDLASSSNTIGALDLGGASTQITWEPSGTWDSNSNNTFSMKIGNYQYSLYVHSYLGWGGVEAVDKYRASLITGPTTFSDPCLPQGYNETWEYNSQNYTVNGSGNYTDCKSGVDSQVLFNNSICDNPPCTFDNVYMPNIPSSGKQFDAFSLFYYTSQFFNFTSTSNPQQFFDQATTYCDLTWSQIESQYGSTDPFLSSYCFDAVYAGSLLKAYKFNMSSFDQISFQGTIKGVDIGWAYGSMIYEANYLPIDFPGDSKSQVDDKYPNDYLLSTTGGIILMVFSCIGFVVSLAVIAFIKVGPQDNRNPRYKAVEQQVLLDNEDEEEEESSSF